MNVTSTARFSLVQLFRYQILEYWLMQDDCGIKMLMVVLNKCPCVCFEGLTCFGISFCPILLTSCSIV